MRYMNLIALIVSLVCASSFVSANDNTTKDTKGKHLDVIQNGKVIARYMYAHDPSSKESRHETYKPYLHVMSPDGKTPITKGAGGQFTHHRGIFLGWNRIGFKKKSYDLWHMKTGPMADDDDRLSRAA